MKKIVFVLFLVILFSLPTYAQMENLNLGIGHFNYSDLSYFEELAKEFNSNENIKDKIKVEQGYSFYAGGTYKLNELFKVKGEFNSSESIYGDGSYYIKEIAGNIEKDGIEITTVTEGRKSFDLSLNNITGKVIFDLHDYINISLGPAIVFGTYKEEYKHLEAQKVKAIEKDTGIVIEGEKIIDEGGYLINENIFDLGFEAGITVKYYIGNNMDVYADISYRYLETEIDEQRLDLSGIKIGLGILLNY